MDGRKGLEALHGLPKNAEVARGSGGWRGAHSVGVDEEEYRSPLCRRLNRPNVLVCCSHRRLRGGAREVGDLRARVGAEKGSEILARTDESWQICGADNHQNPPGDAFSFEGRARQAAHVQKECL